MIASRHSGDGIACCRQREAEWSRRTEVRPTGRGEGAVVGPTSVGRGEWCCRADFSRPRNDGGLKSALQVEEKAPLWGRLQSAGVNGVVGPTSVGRVTMAD